jgi:lysyl-tRNA synthetase, class II
MSKDKIRAERLEKLARLRALGVDPFGGRVKATGDIAHVRSLCPAEHVEGQAAPVVIAAGRVMAIRDMGKSKWIDLVDRSGKVQANLLQKRIGDAFEQAKLLDIGDFIEITGELLKSKVGEVTIFATSFRFLCKNVEPLPEKWQGLKDVEIRYRRRYLDLVANDESRQRFILRSRIISFIRRFLDERGFLEVETPMLQAIYGGAAARPFVTHHNALGVDLFMRISPETYLKRLLVGGLDRVYEINRNFRNEGIDTSHNPEFTMIEVYQAFADFEVMMDLTETLVATAAKELLGGARVKFGDQEIDLAAPWPRKRIHDLVREAGADPADDAAMTRLLEARRLLPPEKRKKMDALPTQARHDMLLKEIMDEVVEPAIVQPTFVTHHPASLNPLCKRNAQDPTLSDRFEVIVAGMELANAFSELNDPVDQRARFEEQVKQGDAEEGYCNAVDEDYVSALEVGLPPAGGLGIGIDRLVMLLTGQTSIRVVILFPTLKPRTPEEQKALEEGEEGAGSGVRGTE